QQEYSKLFASDGLGVFSDTEYSSHGDWTQNGSLYGNFDHTGFAVDGYYRSNRGFRPNNDVNQWSVDGRVKQEFTDKDSVFAQVGYFWSDSGDLAQYYYQTNADKTLRVTEEQNPNLLAGYHREWSPGNHTLFLFSRIADDLTLTSQNANPLA